MIQFEKTQTFINRVLIPCMLIRAEPLCQAFADETIEFVKWEQRAIERLFEEFKSEMSANLESLPREQHKAYLSQVYKLFTIEISSFDAIDNLTVQLFTKYGVNYQHAAWNILQDELKTFPFNDESKIRFSYLILIATDGAAYYKNAFNITARQLNASLEPEQLESRAASSNMLIKNFIKTDEGKLKLRIVALLYSYEGMIIPKKTTDANLIAHQYGHNSGASLYKQYCKVSKRFNRIGVDGKALTPMIEDIEAVLPLLSDTAKQIAKDELRTLKAKK